MMMRLKLAGCNDIKVIKRNDANHGIRYDKVTGMDTHTLTPNREQYWCIRL